MNSVAVVGRLTRDPEARRLPSGQPVADMRIAIPRARGRGLVFVDVDAFGPLAGKCIDRLREGSPIAVQGRLEFDEWSTPTGRSSRNFIVAECINVLEEPATQPAPAVAATGRR